MSDNIYYACLVGHTPDGLEVARIIFATSGVRLGVELALEDAETNSAIKSIVLALRTIHPTIMISTQCVLGMKGKLT